MTNLICQRATLSPCTYLCSRLDSLYMSCHCSWRWMHSSATGTWQVNSAQSTHMEVPYNGMAHVSPHLIKSSFDLRVCRPNDIWIH